MDGDRLDRMPQARIKATAWGQPKMRIRLLAGAAGAMLGLTALPAAAEMDEIVVEATRRAQDLQDVPLAVSAFTADRIEKLQIVTVQDIGDSIPNLQTYTVTAGAQAMQVHARGASVQNPGFNTSESPVGIYEDDVYRGRLASANLDLTDVERIEVLRGPQATLYGRNTIAGAIKIVTRTPDDEFWANGSVGYGKYATTKITGSVGGPIEEGALAGSVAFSYHDRGEGYFGNPVTGSSPGEYDNKAARAKLHWYGSEGLDARLSVWAIDATNDGYNGVPYLPFPPTPGAVPGAPVAGFYDTLSADGANSGATDQAGVTLDLTWALGATELRSITAFTDIDDAFAFDLAGGGLPNVFFPPPPDFLPGLLIDSTSEMEQWSQEFQWLGSSFGDRLSWITGAFFLSEEGAQQYAGLLSPIFNFIEHTKTDTKSYAVFAEGTWRLTDRLAVTLGGRWTKDEKEFDITCTGNTGSGTGSCTPNNGAFTVSVDEGFDEFTPKLGLEYQIGENWLSYAMVSRGFQAGGFQTLCFGNLLCAGAAYDPQDVWSYEIGFKSDLFADTLRLNGAVFFAQYDDLQQSVITPVPGGVIFPTQNVGEADVWGIELEALWVPVDNLNIFGTLGFMDDDYGTLNPASGAAAAGATDLPSNPDFAIRAGFDYTLEVLANLDLFFGADFSYTDEYYTEATNALLIDDYTRVNAFVGIGRPDGRWQLVGEWKNLGNDEDNVSGLVADFATNIRTVLPPLEYMVTFRMKY
jgi:iron complex outermembrane receptor protein